MSGTNDSVSEHSGIHVPVPSYSAVLGAVAGELRDVQRAAVEQLQVVPAGAVGLAAASYFSAETNL